MRLIYDEHEKPPVLAQAEDAERAGEQLLAASLRGMAENGIDLSRDWETLRVGLYARHDIDVAEDGQDTRVA
ncbi:hypothetical protein ACH4OX_32740 [Streptomyces roseolus]|uniref:hypothetical protein n=1 Tax=Streptomyces roseolus TaxID=67358 RepID=UPI003793B18F